MIFRKQSFLGQVPFSTPMGRITSGASTYTAQNICKMTKQKAVNPDSVSDKQILEEWSRVANVREMEDDTYYHMQAWCPEAINLVERLTGRIKVYPPKPEPIPEGKPKIFPPPLQTTPVATPATKRVRFFTPWMEHKAPASVTSAPTATPPATRPPVTTPGSKPRVIYEPISMQKMSREDLIRAALTMPGSGSGITPITYSPTTYAQMPMMNGPRRLRVMNLGGSNEDLAWFEANRVQLAQQYPGQYVIIKDLAVRGAYPDFQSAYNAGVAMFGTQPFEVKQAVAEQRVEHA